MKIILKGAAVALLIGASAAADAPSAKVTVRQTEQGSNTMCEFQVTNLGARPISLFSVNVGPLAPINARLDGPDPSPPGWFESVGGDDQPSGRAFWKQWQAEEAAAGLQRRSPVDFRLEFAKPSKAVCSTFKWRVSDSDTVPRERVHCSLLTSNEPQPKLRFTQQSLRRAAGSCLESLLRGSSRRALRIRTAQAQRSSEWSQPCRPSPHRWFEPR